MKDNQFIQLLRAINNVRDDLKDEMRDFKNEMNRRWDENDKRWEENERRWIEVDKKLEDINKRIDKTNEKVDTNYKKLCSAFDAYENSIENMYQDNRQRIIILEKRLKVASA